MAEQTPPSPAAVLVIGDLMVDLSASYVGTLQHGSDTPAEVQVNGGGSAANTACWLAAQGVLVRLLAGVGADLLGQQALAMLANSGVQFVGVADTTQRTGSCVVLVDESGERTMLPDRGANDALAVELVRASLQEQPAWLHLSGYTLLDEGSRPAGLAALAEARAQSVPVSVDASSAAPLRSVGAQCFLEWIDGIDVLFANGEELAVLAPDQQALTELHKRVGSVITKLGAAGARWSDGHHDVHAAAVPVEVVDSTGAGDAFAAGYLASLMQGRSTADCLAAGCAVAAKVVGIAGARPQTV